jgi:hypothetical protein
VVACNAPGARAFHSARSPYPNRKQEQRAAAGQQASQPGLRADQAGQPGDTCRHQHRVGQRAENDDGADVFAPQALAQYEGVLRADGDDQAEGQCQALQGRVEQRGGGGKGGVIEHGAQLAGGCCGAPVRLSSANEADLNCWTTP